jgi:hypothetical protein
MCYILRSTKPRLRTVWKARLREETEQLKELQEKKRNLTCLIAVGLTEALGLDLSAWALWDLRIRGSKLSFDRGNLRD